MEILDYDFMRRALVASVLVGLAAPVVGIYLVQRRLALIGDGMGHVALTGVAIGLLTGTAPVFTALVFAIGAAVLIEVLRARGGSTGATADVLLAVIFYGGIAGGVVLIGLSGGGSAAQLNTYLFGAITTTSGPDLVVFAVLAVVVLAIAVGLAPRLFAVSNDEEYARAGGLNVLGLNLLLAVLTATTVVISMRVVGLLLISALMILPNAVGQQVARSFRGSLLVAAGVGVGVSVTGTASSYYLKTPSGGTIVLLAVTVFVLSALGATAVRAAHARRHHTVTEHRHEHGLDCGHEVVPHEDHLDYVHDGHRHAAHGAHYDDH